MRVGSSNGVFRVAPMLALIALALVLIAAQPGERAPGLDSVDLSGARVSLSAMRGHVVVVDFWASWCEPCRQSFPVLASLAQRHAGRGLVVIGVSVDERLANCARFIQQLRPPFPIVHDATQSIAAQWQPASMPSTFVIDRMGNVRAAHAGFNDAIARALEREVSDALGVAP